MADSGPGSHKPLDLQKGLEIAATVGGILAPAALFYGVGYAITQAYVINVGLNGTFWFNEFFYREAGARFALDVLAALVLLPHVVLALSVALFLFLPTPGAGGWRDGFFSGQAACLCDSRPMLRPPCFVALASPGRRLLVFLAVVGVALAVLAGLTHFAAVDPREAAGSDLARWTTNHLQWLFADYLFLPRVIREHLFDAKPLLYPTAILLAVAMPVLAAFVALAVHAWRAARPGTDEAAPAGLLARQVRHGLGLFWSLASLMLGAYVVVAYGGFFYDFTAMPVMEKHKCLPIGKDAEAKLDKSNTPVLDCYLVGRFDKWYVLLGWERTGEQTIEPPIYIKQVDVLEPFAILTGPGTPVRGILRQLDEYTLAGAAVAPAVGSESADGRIGTGPGAADARTEPPRAKP